MLEKEDFENIGYVQRTHGIQGELACKTTVDLSFISEDEDRYFLMLEEQGLLIPYAVEGFRTKTDEIDLISFSGIETKEQAETLVGSSLWLSRDYLDDQELSEDPYDFARYLGFNLIDANRGVVVGTISHIDETTMNTLLYVDTTSGDELILPIAEELFTAYNDDERTLTLDIPEGLLDN